MNYNGASTYAGNVIPLDAEISPGVTVAAALQNLLTIGPQVRVELAPELVNLDKPVSTRATPGDIFAAV